MLRIRVADDLSDDDSASDPDDEDWWSQSHRGNQPSVSQNNIADHASRAALEPGNRTRAFTFDSSDSDNQLAEAMLGRPRFDTSEQWRTWASAQRAKVRTLLDDQDLDALLQHAENEISRLTRLENRHNRSFSIEFGETADAF